MPPRLEVSHLSREFIWLQRRLGVGGPSPTMYFVQTVGVLFGGPPVLKSRESTLPHVQAPPGQDWVCGVLTCSRVSGPPRPVGAAQLSPCIYEATLTEEQDKPGVFSRLTPTGGLDSTPT